ncbi:MAG: LamG domain-containing protein [Candidatus Saccharimonadales bacterium]
MGMWAKTKSSRYFNSAFTIVELLVVIVVIGVLAAITVVSYTGITNRAAIASAQSDLSNASKKLKLYQLNNDNEDYPVDKATAIASNLIPDSDNLSYYVDNNTDPKTFCLSYINQTNNIAYSINQDGSPIPAPYCPILYLDASKPDSYPGSGTTWYDLSGLANNATLTNGPTFIPDSGGAFSFDGVNDHADIHTAPSLVEGGSIIAWIYISNWTTSYDSIVFKGPNLSWPDIDYGLFRNGTSNTFLGTLNDGVHNMSGSGPKSSAISLGHWYQLVFTWDGSITKFYTNGLQTGAVGYIYEPGDRSSEMKIGSHVFGSGYFFNGQIAKVKLFERSINEDEVLINFNITKGRYGL